MLKAVDNALTIVHIRISNVKLLGFKIRHIITSFLIIFIIFNTLRVFSAVSEGNILGFIEAGVFIVLTLYLALAWIISWPKAGKMLNKASEYEQGKDSDDRKDSD